ncbi:hypothetical protein BN7_2614 [Wickerhamomyces ciferrii]|uniref:Uncharacterized protein n=1 Tax=Wickerhamomyces ciferrii (strain ATCC 14091 / BCRC 22168 / CBS 111 / JCM 3599 / NBRC 0793 / NRRL Y-1031 F-60-10) TaxID=1206466 RepID=K0KLH9_WICCF|nr:uncharacterized protein BN7_2614 [Wickerhamomyces ciferrii]CCH43067.1 hypothetical protein BN7_2614 [Wickerhamomyces ciferrii]
MFRDQLFTRKNALFQRGETFTSNPVEQFNAKITEERSMNKTFLIISNCIIAQELQVNQIKNLQRKTLGGDDEKIEMCKLARVEIWLRLKLARFFTVVELAKDKYKVYISQETKKNFEFKNFKTIIADEYIKLKRNNTYLNFRHQFWLEMYENESVVHLRSEPGVGKVQTKSCSICLSNHAYISNCLHIICTLSYISGSGLQVKDPGNILEKYFGTHMEAGTDLALTYKMLIEDQQLFEIIGINQKYLNDIDTNKMSDNKLILLPKSITIRRNSSRVKELITPIPLDENAKQQDLNRRLEKRKADNRDYYRGSRKKKAVKPLFRRTSKRKSKTNQVMACVAPDSSYDRPSQLDHGKGYTSQQLENPKSVPIRMELRQ